jgi:hypothetical protein
MEPGLRSIVEGYGRGADGGWSGRRRESRERLPDSFSGSSGAADIWRDYELQGPLTKRETKERRPRSVPRRTLGLLLVLAVAAALLVVALVTGRSSAPAPKRPVATAPKGRALPLSVRWNLFGARPMITVRVGNGPPVPVLLDTGSTGLHIYAAGVHLGPNSGVTLTRHADSATYFDGTIQQGVFGRAKLTIDGVPTTTSVTFALITSIGCVHQIPCPARDGIGAAVGRHEYGILGIGLRRDPDGLRNPLLALPRADGRSWSIVLGRSHGSLIVGAPDPVRPLAHFTLAPDGRQVNGQRTWRDDRVHVCWGAVGLHGAGCEPTVFDTGSEIIFWYGGLMSHATTYPGSILVNPGTYIAAWQPGQPKPFWSFTAGTDASRDTVLALNLGHPGVIAAVQAFLSFNITYDDTRGEIFVARRPRR